MPVLTSEIVYDHDIARNLRWITAQKPDYDGGLILSCNMRVYLVYSALNCSNKTKADTVSVYFGSPAQRRQRSSAEYVYADSHRPCTAMEFTDLQCTVMIKCKHIGRLHRSDTPS